MSSGTHTRWPWLVLVGGFLGAGKTTLLLAAAKKLERRGLRSAIILNDQGDALVDTAMARRNDVRFGEVTGGCFCCRFSNFVDVLEDLRAYSPDVIFAEPVGSCTDLSATILAPLRAEELEYQLAPFTVLVDPDRASELLAGHADENLNFLFTKQIEEADLLCFTKSDVYPEVPQIAFQHTRQISARTGAGVSAWLDEVLSGTLSAGTKVLDIDYVKYAQAEAALAWLNLTATLSSQKPIFVASILGPLLDDLDRSFTEAGISIVHLKAIAGSPYGHMKAAICRNGQEPIVEGAMDFSTSTTHDLLLNLRAVGDANNVRSIVEQALARIDVHMETAQIACFHPAPPKPERRIGSLK